MSRIGKQAIMVPGGTQISVVDLKVAVKGPKGELTRRIAPGIEIVIENNQVSVLPPKEGTKDKKAGALWGTTAAHIRNMVKGVNEPYLKHLILEGVGYKADVRGTKLVMALGFSHPVEIEIPRGLTVTADKEGVKVTGPDKDQVGQFAATVRALKKPEPYKGKGFHYSDETILRKQGKKASA